MKLKYLGLVVLAVFSVMGLDYVFAQESSISVKTDDYSYDEGDVIVISGNVSTVMGSTPITLQLFTEGNLVEVASVIVAQDGTYSHTILAEGPLWKKEGQYTVRVSYGVGNTTKTEFSYSPSSYAVQTRGIFEVQLGSKGTFDVEYTIKGGVIKDMIINSNIFALIVQINVADEGSITLDLPREFIGAKKQDGKDDTFIILIDGIGVKYQEFVTRSESRTVTINFEKDDSSIEIIGTYTVPHIPTTNAYNPSETGCGKGTIYDPETQWCTIIEESPRKLDYTYPNDNKEDELQKENTTLKLENRQLKQKITSQQGEIDELQDLLINGLKEIYNWKSNNS